MEKSKIDSLISQVKENNKTATKNHVTIDNLSTDKSIIIITQDSIDIKRNGKTDPFTNKTVSVKNKAETVNVSEKVLTKNKLKAFEVENLQQLFKFRSLLDSYAVEFINYFKKLHKKSVLFENTADNKIEKYNQDRAIQSLINLPNDLNSFQADIVTTLRQMMHLDSINAKFIAASLSSRFPHEQERKRALIKTGGKYLKNTDALDREGVDSLTKTVDKLFSKSNLNLGYKERSVGKISAADKAAREAMSSAVKLTTSNFQRGASYLNPANYLRAFSSTLALGTMGRFGTFYDPTRRTDEETFFGGRTLRSRIRGEMSAYDYQREIEKKYAASTRGSRLLSPFTADIEASPILRTIMNIDRSLAFHSSRNPLFSRNMKESRFSEYFDDGKMKTGDYFDLLRRYQMRNVNPDDVSGKFVGNLSPMAKSIKEFDSLSVDFASALKKASSGLKGDQLNVFKSLAVSLLEVGDSGEVLVKKLGDLRNQFEGDEGHFAKIMEKIAIFTPKEREKFIKNYLMMDQKEMRDDEGNVISLSPGDYSEIEKTSMYRRRAKFNKDKEAIVNSLAAEFSSEAQTQDFLEIAEEYMKEAMSMSQFKSLMREEQLKMMTGTFFARNRRNRVDIDTGDKGRIGSFFENIRAGNFFQTIEQAVHDVRVEQRKNTKFLDQVREKTMFMTRSMMNKNILSRLASRSGDIGKESKTWGAVGQITGFATGVVSTAIGSITKLAGFVGSSLFKAGKLLVNAMHTTFVKLKDMTVSILQKTGKALTFFGLGLAALYALHKADLLKHIPEALKKALEITKTLVNDYVIPFVKGVVDAANTAMKELVAEMRVFLLTNGFYEIPQKLVDFFKEFFSGETSSGIGETFRVFGNNIMEAGGVLLEALHQLWNGLTEVFTETLWPDYLEPAFNHMKDVFYTIWDNVLEFFSESLPKWWSESFIPFMDSVFSPNRERASQQDVVRRKNEIEQLKTQTEVIEQNLTLSEQQKQEIELNKKRIRDLRSQNFQDELSLNVVEPMADATNKFIDYLKMAGIAIAGLFALQLAAPFITPLAKGGVGLTKFGFGGGVAGAIARKTAAKGSAVSGAATGAAGAAGAAAGAAGAARALHPNAVLKSGVTMTSNGKFMKGGKFISPGDAVTWKTGPSGAQLNPGYTYDPKMGRYRGPGGALAKADAAVATTTKSSTGKFSMGGMRGFGAPSAIGGVGGMLVGGMALGQSYSSFSEGRTSEGVGNAIGAGMAMSGNPWLMAAGAIILGTTKIAQYIEESAERERNLFFMGEKLSSKMKQELKEEIKYSVGASDAQLEERREELNNRIGMYNKMLETGQLIDNEGNELTREQIHALRENTERLKQANDRMYGKNATERLAILQAEIDAYKGSPFGKGEGIYGKSMITPEGGGEAYETTNLDRAFSFIRGLGKDARKTPLRAIANQMIQEGIFTDIEEFKSVFGELERKGTGQGGEFSYSVNLNQGQLDEKLRTFRNETLNNEEATFMRLRAEEARNAMSSGMVKEQAILEQSGLIGASEKYQEALSIQERVAAGENVLGGAFGYMTKEEAAQALAQARSSFDQAQRDVVEKIPVGISLPELIQRYQDTHGEGISLTDVEEMEQKQQIKKELEAHREAITTTIEGQEGGATAEQQEKLDRIDAILYYSGRLDDLTDLSETEMETIRDLIFSLERNTDATDENTDKDKKNLASHLFGGLLGRVPSSATAQSASLKFIEKNPQFAHYGTEFRTLYELAGGAPSRETSGATAGATGAANTPATQAVREGVETVRGVAEASFAGAVETVNKVSDAAIETGSGVMKSLTNPPTIDIGGRSYGVQEARNLLGNFAHYGTEFRTLYELAGGAPSRETSGATAGATGAANTPATQAVREGVETVRGVAEASFAGAVETVNKVSDAAIETGSGVVESLTNPPTIDIGGRSYGVQEARNLLDNFGLTRYDQDSKSLKSALGRVKDYSVEMGKESVKVTVNGKPTEFDLNDKASLTNAYQVIGELWENERDPNKRKHLYDIMKKLADVSKEKNFDSIKRNGDRLSFRNTFGDDDTSFFGSSPAKLAAFFSGKDPMSVEGRDEELARLEEFVKQNSSPVVNGVVESGVGITTAASPPNTTARGAVIEAKNVATRRREVLEKQHPGLFERGERLSSIEDRAGLVSRALGTFGNLRGGELEERKDSLIFNLGSTLAMIEHLEGRKTNISLNDLAKEIIQSNKSEYEKMPVGELLRKLKTNMDRIRTLGRNETLEVNRLNAEFDKTYDPTANDTQAETTSSPQQPEISPPNSSSLQPDPAAIGESRKIASEISTQPNGGMVNINAPTNQTTVNNFGGGSPKGNGEARMPGKSFNLYPRYSSFAGFNV